MAYLMASMASSRGSTPLMAKKQVCMMVLMRPPMPVSLGHFVAVDDVELQLLVDDLLLHRRGRWSQTSSGPKGLLSRKVAPGSAHFSMSMRSRKENWWQATKLALVIR